jgi:uncharacterized MAPEG superfamily protein
MPSSEMLMLALSCGLGLLQIVAASHAASWQRGYRWTASARDESLPPLSGIAGRLARTVTNFTETFPFFAAAVLALQVTNHSSQLSVLGASLYFWARVAYVVVYALGVPLVRSLIWNVAFAGIVMLIVALFI